ncbi:nuclear transport factor 2 family protein [Amycolatopsis echigonensis]|uniref:Ketosteroid isomerase-like protein n=1 Tax=Amycolatopsis echigonensis TaxID=2576905 RepID=A0A2N3WLU5_9PSEU|nr:MULTISPECIES: nuclear transport factor 2 family protein [Amycolatopsis]MBB2501902.1 nuclear transport factor 2 family protein [Amycolatopsis echigonensis]PKV94830.1 ketosteroid isomerase-like protein [Amycolatopsis niigatensis]
MPLIDHALDLLIRHDMAGFVQLFAEDAVAEFPFAAPGRPERLEGRAALADYLRDYPNLLDIREVAAKTVHQTTDPEVSIAEFELAGVAVATQKPYRLRYIVVLTVRDGLIRRYRDYWSPLAVADVLGVPGV